MVAADDATLATGTAEREAAAAFSQSCPRGRPSAPTMATIAEAFVEGSAWD
jgi:hypothetical protein